MAADAAKAADREKRARAQDDVQAAATWQFLGADPTQLWLLNDEQLRLQAERAEVGTAGDRDDLIGRIAAAARRGGGGGGNGPMLEAGGASKRPRLADASASSSSSSSSSSSVALVVRDGGGGGADAGTVTASASAATHGAAPRVTREALPENLHAMTAEQLRSVCAALGLLRRVPAGAVKADYLDILEGILYGDNDGEGTCQGDGGRGGAAGAGDEEEEEGSEYEEEEAAAGGQDDGGWSP